MQDPTIFQQIKSPQFPDQEQIKCPRCDSTNTKFCYYNNYNLSQPRHFCKNCRRYWTKGGALRNIPVGGGIRKNTKRSSNPNKRQSSSTSSATQISHQKPQPTGIFTSAITGIDPDHQMLDISGSFSSLLASSNGQFGNLLVNPNNVSREVHHQFGEFVENSENSTSNRTTLELQSNGNQGNLLGISSGGGGGGGGGDSSCWNGGNGWPDLAIYTPGSNFQ